MSRYIDADTLKVSITRYAETFLSHKRLPITKSITEEIIHDVCFAIDMQKSEDVVPVVRCKDCVWYGARKNKYDIGFCNFTDHVTTPEKFCADGEKVSK